MGTTIAEIREFEMVKHIVIVFYIRISGVRLLQLLLHVCAFLITYVNKLIFFEDKYAAKQMNIKALYEL